MSGAPAEIPPQIRRFAEEPDDFLGEPDPPSRLLRRPRFMLRLMPSPTLSVVAAPRTSEAELDDTIGEVRRLVTDSGYTRCAWYVGPSSRPHGLAALLAARGFVPATRPPLESHATAMALVEPPPAGPAGVETRAPRDLDEYVQAIHIVVAAFGQSKEDAAGWLAAAPELWKQQDGIKWFTHLALLDGRPVGFAFSGIGKAGLLLNGSGVLPEARGRGVYRALVAVRWEDAVRRGTPALVVQAGAMSEPILASCGFQTICRLDVLDDPRFLDAGAGT
jgi:GNAT superfamily N-acetyltransferase